MRAFRLSEHTGYPARVVGPAPFAAAGPEALRRLIALRAPMAPYVVECVDRLYDGRIECVALGSSLRRGDLYATAYRHRSRLISPEHAALLWDLQPVALDLIRRQREMIAALAGFAGEVGGRP